MSVWSTDIHPPTGCVAYVRGGDMAARDAALHPRLPRQPRCGCPHQTRELRRLKGMSRAMLRASLARMNREGSHSSHPSRHTQVFDAYNLHLQRQLASTETPPPKRIRDPEKQEQATTQARKLSNCFDLFSVAFHHHARTHRPLNHL